MSQNIALNEIVRFCTDAATLVIYDPETIKERVNSTVDWWCDADFKDLEEVKNGLISLVSLGGDGAYKIRLTTEFLTEDEKDFSRSVIGPLGVASKSGKIFIGRGECLPGGGDTILPNQIASGDGKFIELPVGNYDLLFYYINADGYASEKKIKSLPNIVIVITERINVFAGVAQEPCLIYSFTDPFLFPSKKNANKLKPKLNKILKAKVWSTDRTASRKAIKEERGIFWPTEYRGWEIILEDMSKVEWRDRIVIKTTHLDEEKKIIYAELIEKLPRQD